MMDRAVAWLLVALGVAVLGAFTVLTLAGRDTTSLALLLAGPTVSGVVGALLAKRTAAVGADVAVVRHQTNTMLSDHLDALGGQLDDAHDDRLRIAGQVRTAPPRSADLPARPVPNPDAAGT